MSGPDSQEDLISKIPNATLIARPNRLHIPFVNVL